MTASNSRGKMGKTYPYYRCWIKGCGAAQVRAERLEQAFSDLLRRIEISPGMVRLIEASLLDIWHELRHESTQQAVTAKKRVAAPAPPGSAAFRPSSSPKASLSTERGLEPL